MRRGATRSACASTSRRNAPAGGRTRRGTGRVRHRRVPWIPVPSLPGGVRRRPGHRQLPSGARAGTPPTRGRRGRDGEARTPTTPSRAARGRARDAGGRRAPCEGTTTTTTTPSRARGARLRRSAREPRGGFVSRRTTPRVRRGRGGGAGRSRAARAKPSDRRRPRALVERARERGAATARGGGVSCGDAHLRVAHSRSTCARDRRPGGRLRAQPRVSAAVVGQRTVPSAKSARADRGRVLGLQMFVGVRGSLDLSRPLAAPRVRLHRASRIRRPCSSSRASLRAIERGRVARFLLDRATSTSPRCASGTSHV